VRTLSDDGVRVRLDGEVLLEDWTWHGPREHRAEFTLPLAREIALGVEHFELDGYAVLRCELERLAP
jgi:hypothetical protein